MPIIFKTGDIFEDDAEAYVCPVNCEGVMGRGLAKAFAAQFPRLNAEYRAWCGHVLRPTPGDVFAHRTLRQFTPPRLVFCVATKDSWKHPSRHEWIEEGVRRLADEVTEYGIATVAVPALGCGNGGLSWWGSVRTTLEFALIGHTSEFRIYETHG